MDSTEAKKEAYKKLEKERVRLISKMDELSQESAEHSLVLKTLSTLPDDRRCYRIIGSVAVERTVAEVRPALKAYTDKVNELHDKTKENLDFINQEIDKLTGAFKVPTDAA